MGVVVGVVGVHWLLLQTFSHVDRIQLKVLKDGDSSSQVRYGPTTGLDPLGGVFGEWIFFLAVSVLDAKHTGWTGGWTVHGISV